MIYKGFLPFFDENSEILILGSFPSVISRETNFYYGNKQNRFWKILSEAFGEPAPETIGEKQALLKNHKIALWDVVAECEITGSLDSTIKNYKVADLQKVLDKAKIKKIILNGGKAKEIFLKNYKYLSDANPNNAFIIERFLSTKLKLKPTDTFVTYETTETDESVN